MQKKAKNFYMYISIYKNIHGQIFRRDRSRNAGETQRGVTRQEVVDGERWQIKEKQNR